MNEKGFAMNTKREPEKTLLDKYLEDPSLPD